VPTEPRPAVQILPYAMRLVELNTGWALAEPVRWNPVGSTVTEIADNVILWSRQLTSWRSTYSFDLEEADRLLRDVAAQWLAESPREPLSLDAYLTGIYAAAESDGGIDRIFNFIDDLLLEGNFRRVDDILNAIDPNKAPTVVLLSLLTVTLPAKHEVVARTRFFFAVKSVLEYRKGSDKARQLLEGLE